MVASQLGGDASAAAGPKDAPPPQPPTWLCALRFSPTHAHADCLLEFRWKARLSSAAALQRALWTQADGKRILRQEKRAPQPQPSVVSVSGRHRQKFVGAEITAVGAECVRLDADSGSELPGS